MELQKTTQDGVTTLALSGRLDSLTSATLDRELQAVGGSAKIVLDFSDVSYLSSAGLRVLLAGHKRAKAENGSLQIRNIIPTVMSVFEMTGFSDLLSLD